MTPKRRAVTIRRVYDPPGDAEGYRALVDRLWPRGVKRTPELFDEWAKDAAPSPDLRRWYGHDPAKFAEFATRYRAELELAPARDAVARLAALAARKPLTLLTATKDVDRSGALVLAQAIEEAAASPS
jgi:uncharacterized protein YeaO (DUF488 family)